MLVEVITAAAASGLSLFMGYVPGVSEWYDGLGPVHKRLVMLILLLLVVGLILGLACAGLPDIFEVEAACTESFALALARAFFIALGANQGTYLLSTKSSQK